MSSNDWDPARARAALEAAAQDAGMDVSAFLGSLRLDAALGGGARDAMEESVSVTANDAGTALHGERVARGLEVASIFGPMAEHSVRAFQQAHGLSVDGIVGPDTYAAMHRAREAALAGFASQASLAVPGADRLDALFTAARRGDDRQVRTALQDFADTPIGRVFETISDSLKHTIAPTR